MKKIKIITGICLILTMLFSTFAVGCGKKKNRINNINIGGSSTFDGTHYFNAESTGKFIVSEGQTDYAILLPADASETLFSAAFELARIFNTASGASIQIVSEPENESGAKFISLGKTRLSASAGVLADASLLGVNGYRIITNGDNVYVCGGGDRGTLNGVYGFLEHAAGFRVYAPDEVQTSKGNIELYKYSVTNVPDIQYRFGNHMLNELDGDNTYRKRLRFDATSEVYVPVTGNLVYHNTLLYFPVNQYGHNRDWYFDGGGSSWIDFFDICYSAHGKEDELNAMLEIAAGKIIEAMKTSDAENVAFTQSDSDAATWCRCSACTASLQKYGTNAAVVIKFVNRLSDLVAEKLTAAGNGGRKFNIVFFAYAPTEAAPTVKSANGVYTPIDDSVVCRDNVIALYAPIYGNYTQPFTSDENTAYFETLRAWRAISKKSFMWTYSTNYFHYLYPYNSFSTMQGRYKLFAANGVDFLIDQNQTNQRMRTSFNRLKSWLFAKLSWNVNADYFGLLDEYFKGYFYEAAGSMRELFDSVTYHMEYLDNETDMGQGEISITSGINQAKYFPSALLDKWLALTEDAYAAIASYKDSDSELYQKLADRIKLESLSVRCMILDLYPGKYTPSVLRNMQVKFMNDCFALGVTHDAEQKSINDKFTLWGIL